MLKRLAAVAALLAATVVMLGAIAASDGIFYETGAQYYTTCWEKQKAVLKRGEASTPAQAVLWARCSTLAEKTMDDLGWASTPIDAQPPGCPGRFAAYNRAFHDTDYILAVDAIEKTGGPSLIDWFTPASWLIARALKARWPHCTY